MPHDDRDMNAPDIADLLKPYKSAAVAEALAVTGDTVRLWKARKSTPTFDKAPALATFLRIEQSEVVAAIAAAKVAA